MNSQHIAIVTDSGTDTPEQFAADHDVKVVPLGINYSDGSHFQAGVDITTRQIIDRFSQEIPKTSLPSPNMIKTAFEKARAEGYEKAVFVSISSGLSATNQTVHLIASEMDDFPIIVVDTKSIGIAAGLVVIAATRMIEAGIPFEELQGRLDALSTDTHVFFCVKDLTYLHAGGRIDDFTYRVGSVLNIKPIIWCDAEGHYRTYKKSRGWERALRTEVACIKEFAGKFPKVIIAIACTEADNYFDKLESMLRAEIPNISEVIRSGISPALIVHTGPELVGMGVQPTWE